jgi:O-antigen/teichoic acid export membrane protein
VVYRDAPALHAPLWLVAASLIPTAFTCVAESVLIGQQRMHAAAAWSVAESLLRTGGAFIVIMLGFGLTAVFAVFLAGRVLIVLGYYRFAGFRELLQSGRLERRELARYVRELPAFLGIMICAAVLSRMDIILLSQLGTLHDVGLYAAPYKLYEVALMTPSLLSVVFFPLFSSLFAGDRTRFETLLGLTLQVFLFLGTPFVIAAIYLAPEIMRVYGPDYVQASGALQLLIVGLVFVSVNQLLSTVMLVSHNQHLNFQSLALTCVVYTALLVATIPEWGFLGAAASTLGAAMLQPMIGAVLLRRQVSIWRLAGPLIKVGSAATAMSGVLFLARGWSAPLALATGLFTYLAVVLFSKGVTTEQVREYLTFLAHQPERV